MVLASIIRNMPMLPTQVSGKASEVNGSQRKNVSYILRSGNPATQTSIVSGPQEQTVLELSKNVVWDI